MSWPEKPNPFCSIFSSRSKQLTNIYAILDKKTASSLFGGNHFLLMSVIQIVELKHLSVIQIVELNHLLVSELAMRSNEDAI